MEVKYRVEPSKISLVRTFSDHPTFGLSTLKFHLLHIDVEDLRGFGTLLVLDASRFEQVNVNMKHDYKQTSGETDQKMNETLRIVGCMLNWTWTNSRMH